jgi:lysophospholipase L1-like esterase
MSKKIKVITYNVTIFLLLVMLFETVLGYWFTKNNFGVHMRKERNKNWQTTSKINNEEYKFFYKRNFYGFRGEEFDPKDVKIILEGGSTSNQMNTPQELTIVGQLNKKFKSDAINLKIYNAATNGKSLRGVIYDFKHWFPKIKKFQPEFVILLLGINERTLASQMDKRMFDSGVQEQKIDRVKDYIKNNSFVYNKYKIIANKYFPKNTSGYFLDTKKLYFNFDYVNYKKAKNLKRLISGKEKKILIQLEERLLILKKIFKSNKIKPVIITQVEYNGLNNQKLFLVNEKLKEFSFNNNWQIIKLDELIEMEVDDFYDPAHTTPAGSEKIANIIYPLLKKILNNKD